MVNTLGQVDHSDQGLRTQSPGQATWQALISEGLTVQSQ